MEVLCGKGILIRLSLVEQENITTFIISNFECMAEFVKELKDKSKKRHNLAGTKKCAQYKEEFNGMCTKRGPTIFFFVEKITRRNESSWSSILHRIYHCGVQFSKGINHHGVHFCKG